MAPSLRALVSSANTSAAICLQGPHQAALKSYRTRRPDSRASGRLVLYDFSAAWCGPCRQMAAEVFADETSARKLGAMFVPVHVVDRAREDGRNQPDVQALEDRFRIEAFPTLVVYAPDTGRHVTITG